MNYTQEQIISIVAEAKEAARNAGNKFFREVLKGQDQWACGFAWVKIYDIKGNTKLGKMFAKAGVKRDYDRTLQIWNPSELYCQNVDAKEEGARAAANVFTKYGFTAYAGSRLD